MSADKLRQAAALMRDNAAKAEPGVWKLWGMQVMADTSGTSNVDLATPVAECSTPSTSERRLHTGNATHIASWHPVVALAVADWLDSQVLRWEQVYADTQQASAGVDQPPARHYGDPAAAAATADYHARHALAVANAYLGTP